MLQDIEENQNQGEGHSGGIKNGVAGTIALSSIETNREFDHDIWFVDSGASCHNCNDDKNLKLIQLHNYLKRNSGNVMIAMWNSTAKW